MALDQAAPVAVHAEDRDLVAKLAKLQNMHDQIHGLRSLLPERLLKPAKAALDNPRKNGPAKLGVELKAVAREGDQQLRRFKSDFRSEEMQALWHTTGGADFPQGHDAWMIDYQRLSKVSEQAAAALSTLPNEDGAEDIGLAIEKFKEHHPSIEVQVSEEPSKLPLVLSFDGMSFRIIAEKQHHQRKTYTVTESDSHASHVFSKDIVEILRESSPHASLGAVLSLLGTYTDLKFRSCDVCHSIFDKTISYPLLRSQVPATTEENKAVRWSILHKTCKT